MPTIELGCGCGQFKDFYPEARATDVLESPWCEEITDAQRLPYEDGAVGNYVLIDVLHHLGRPLDFFRRASRTLRPGGRIVMVEPWITPWSSILYGWLHHENCEMRRDFFSEPERPEQQSADYANEATATLLFRTMQDRFRDRFPELQQVLVRPFGIIAYPATGGFSTRYSVIPSGLLPALCRWEDFIISGLGMTFLAVRALIVVQKGDRAT